MQLDKSQIAGLVRAVLSYAAGRFAGAQVFNDPVIAEALSTVVVALVAGWSIRSKKK
jgi:hypothetical protein